MFMYGKDYPNVSANIFAKYKRRVLFIDMNINIHVYGADFYRDAMLARVIAIATCPSVRPSRAGIVSKRRKLAA